MPRYIDANELKEWILNWFEKVKYYHPYSKANNIPIPELYDILEQMPTADVRPNVHGSWLAIGNTGLATCGCGFITDRYSMYRFCPNCGAEMEEA